MPVWINAGSLVLDDQGRPIVCPGCPCDCVCGPCIGSTGGFNGPGLPASFPAYLFFNAWNGCQGNGSGSYRACCVTFHRTHTDQCAVTASQSASGKSVWKASCLNVEVTIECRWTYGLVFGGGFRCDSAFFYRATATGDAHPFPCTGVTDQDTDWVGMGSSDVGVCDVLDIVQTNAPGFCFYEFVFMPSLNGNVCTASRNGTGQPTVLKYSGTYQSDAGPVVLDMDLLYDPIVGSWVNSHTFCSNALPGGCESATPCPGGNVVLVQVQWDGTQYNVTHVMDPAGFACGAGTESYLTLPAAGNTVNLPFCLNTTILPMVNYTITP